MKSSKKIKKKLMIFFKCNKDLKKSMILTKNNLFKLRILLNYHYTKI